MPRKPYPVKTARTLLEGWLERSWAKGAAEAPITVNRAVAYLASKKLPTHRATLHTHGLTALIAVAARRQAEASVRPPSERKSHEAMVAAVREENERLQRQYRELLGLAATLLYNARLHNVSEAEMRRPMPPTDRSVSRAGRRAKRTE